MNIYKRIEAIFCYFLINYKKIFQDLFLFNYKIYIKIIIKIIIKINYNKNIMLIDFHYK